MQSENRAAIMHGVETLGAFLLAGFVIYVFREPLLVLFDGLVHAQNVASAIEAGAVLILGAVFSGLAKKFRASGAVNDYVNEPKDDTMGTE